MAVHDPSPPAEFNLITVIDFKWLMAGAGHRIHVERLQVDRDYALACLVLGAASGTVVLRDSACRLASALQIVLPVR